MSTKYRSDFIRKDSAFIAGQLGSYDINDYGFCGDCNTGHHEWYPSDFLWDEENYYLVTPCCFAEAASAFQPYTLYGKVVSS